MADEEMADIQLLVPLSLADRLSDEADRRGITLDELVSERIAKGLTDWKRKHAN